MFIKPIESSDPSFKLLTASGKLTQALLQLNKQPLNFDPRNYPGALSSHTTDNTPTSTQSKSVAYYIRVYKIPRSALDRYSNLYTADQEWSSAILELTTNNIITIPYIGMTWQSTPVQRLEHDQKAEDPRRLTNLIRCGGIQDSKVYQWCLPALDPVTPQTIRMQPVYSDIERNLIALVIRLALNSASGGLTFDWMPKSNFLARVQQCISGFSQLPVFPTTSTSAFPGVSNAVEPTIQQIKGHLQGMYKYWKDQTSSGMASDQALLEVTTDATNHIRPMGKASTLSVFVTKDITVESCKGGFGYSSSTAGPGPTLEYRIRALLGSTIQMPRIDMWPCTSGCPNAPAAVAFMSRYLMMLKPLLIVSHSAVVAGVLREDTLSHIWQSQDHCDQFMSVAEVTSSHLDLSKYIKVDETYTTINAWPSFTDIVGSIAIIRYGPHPRDYALHIPERHTGSQKYNPMTQNSMCELHLICKAIYIVAVNRISKNSIYLEQASDNDFLTRLNTIRSAINNDLETQGIQALLKEKRTEARKQESKLMSERMGSFHLRNPDAREYDRGDPLGKAVRAAGPPLDEKALRAIPDEVFGAREARSIAGAGERLSQWIQLMKPVKDALDRGIEPRTALCPTNTALLSTAHRDWFLSLPQDAQFKQSAIIKGKKLRTKWGPADWEVYRKQRQDVGKMNRASFNFLQAMMDLSDPASQNRNKRDTYLLLQCHDCGIVELKTSQALHFCSEVLEGKKKIGNSLKDSSLNYRWLHYPHQVYDHLSPEHRIEVQEDGSFAQEDAANIIRHSDLPQEIKDKVPPGFQLGMVFYQDGSNSAEVHWRNTMAMDRFLEHFNMGQFSAIDQGSDDYGLDDDFYKSYNVGSLLEHIGRHIQDPKPVLTQRCGAIGVVRCDRWSIYYPFDKGVQPSGTFKNRQVQHSCPRTGKKSERGIINGGVAICDLLQFPSPLSRRYWHQVRSDEYTQGQTGELSQSNSYSLLGWHVLDRDGAIEWSFGRMESQIAKSKKD